MKVNSIKKTYSNKMVLSFPEFNFEKGKIYAIIGANGSGKSTLGKCLAKVIKPDREPIHADSMPSIAYMSQNNYAFALSTWNNILLASKDKVKDETKAIELMKSIGIYDLKKQLASKLSGGETAKMALVRILLTYKEVLILDEPTASMDVKSTIVSEELIKNYQKENQGTIILITHSIKQAMRLSDYVLFLHEGHLIEYGLVNEVLTSPKNELLKEFINLYSY